MGFLIKSFLTLGLTIGGGLYVVNHVPALRERFIEITNPYTTNQTRLTAALSTNLDALQEAIKENPKSSAVRHLISDSQDLAASIQQFNEEHGGIIQSVVAKAVDLVVGTPEPDLPVTPQVNRTPTPSPKTSPRTAIPLPSGTPVVCPTQ